MKKIMKALEDLVNVAEAQDNTLAILRTYCEWEGLRWPGDDECRPDDAGDYPPEIVRAREILEEKE